MLSAALSTAPASVQVKVRIGKNLDHVLIHGVDLQNHIIIKNKIKRYRGRKKLRFNCQRNQPWQKNTALLAALSSPTGIISWKNQHYLGHLLLTTSNNFNACDLIQNTTMQDYISSLLAKEMGGQWPLEALKAQAIAARSYALFKKKKNYHQLFALENSEKDQVSGSFFDQTFSTRKAAMTTKGLVLTNDRGKIVPAFFHSKCGGRTLLPQVVWPSPVQGFRSVKCPFCHSHGTKNWQRFISQKQMQKIISSTTNISHKTIAQENLRLIVDHNSRDYLRFYLSNATQRIAKSQLRKKLGRKKLPSNHFALTQHPAGFTARGKGFGHGVGMCQYGAMEMARRGKDHRQILAHYYPRLKLKKAY